MEHSRKVPAKPLDRLSTQGKGIVKTQRGLILVGAFLLLANLQSQAEPLSLMPLADAPDFGAGLLNVTYVASSDTFQATGYTTDYSRGSVSPVSHETSASFRKVRHETGI